MIYYLPGRDESRDSHVGAALQALGIPFSGMDLKGIFLTLPFGHQVEQVRQHIRECSDSDEHLLIGRSYGAWLLLHALPALVDVPCRVILFNPVMGKFLNKQSFSGAILPGSVRMKAYLAAHAFRHVRFFDIVSGSLDRQCRFDQVMQFAEQMGAHVRLHLAEGQGHTLSAEGYVEYLNQMLTL